MTQAHDIIVIGASLDGLDALCTVASGFPADLPAAILIVLQTAPDSPSMFAEIVGRHTPLAVSYGQQGDEVGPGHIYFASPDFHLAVVPPGFLVLSAEPKVNSLRPAVDVLFKSAAEAYGPRVIGVVMSGGDHDGTEGLRAIKAAGGLTVMPDMPWGALTGHHPDYRVRLDEMAALLTRLVEGAEV